MPVIKSAIKKFRKDKKRTAANTVFRDELKQAVRTATKTKKAADVQKAFSVIDKASKKHIMHANTASRMKSSLSHMIPATKTPVVAKKTTATKPTKKPAAKKA